MNQNPCIIAGLPVAHRYTPVDLVMTFKNLYRKSGIFQCKKDFQHYKYLMKKRSEESDQ